MHLTEAYRDVHHHTPSLPITGQPQRPLQVLWLHDTARRTGGCEQYMIRASQLLRERGVRSTLLYGDSGVGPLDMLSEFDQAFPVVDLPKQLASIQPDVIYAHRTEGCSALHDLNASGIPTLRFFHDHKLFCPREHKYTVLTRTTCTRSIGAGCYACLGVVTRSEKWPGVRLQTIGKLRDEQAAHFPLSGYVVGSQYMAEHLAQHGFDPSKTHVLPLFAERPIASKKIARDGNLLLFVGQIVRGKGLDILLHALSLTRQPARLMVVGSGNQEDEAKQLVKQLGLSQRVVFVGKKSSHELADLYRRAACLVIPSRSPETFAQVGVEAMSYGLPSIATKVGGISQWLTDDETGLFCEPNDSQSLATVIDRFLGDPALADRLESNSRNDYLTRFQPHFHVDALESLLRATANVSEAH